MGELCRSPPSNCLAVNLLPPSPSPSQPSASELREIGQSSWQAPSKLCCWTGCVWHFQKLLSLSLALSFPALGYCAFKNRPVPSLPTSLLEVQEPQDASICSGVQQQWPTFVLLGDPS